MQQENRNPLPLEKAMEAASLQNNLFNNNPLFASSQRASALGETPQQQRERLQRLAPAMMNLNPPLPNWGFDVKWTAFNGLSKTCSVEGCATCEQAISKAFDFAVKSGWTPPRWWQWWRWGDTRDPRK